MARARVAVDRAMPRLIRSPRPARDVCRSDRCHWPTPEPRSDVVPPRPAVAFQRPTFHGAPRLQPHLGDHTQRHLASTRVQPLTRPQPPPLILLPCHRIRLAVEHPRSDLPAVRCDARPVADLAFRRDLPLDTHRAGASRFASSQAVRASSSQSTLRPTLVAGANRPSCRSQ